MSDDRGQITYLISVICLPAHRYVLGFEKLHHALMGALPPDAALLGAAERRGRIGHEPAVEPYHAVIELFRHPHAAAEVLGVKIRDEAVLGVVRPPDHLVLGPEYLDRGHRPENILVQHGGAVGHAGQDSGGVEKTPAPPGPTPRGHPGAPFHPRPHPPPSLVPA